MLGINGSELIILIVIALVVLGPEKLPEYTRSLTQWIRRMRDMAEGAKTQFKEETGTDFDEVDWRKYDPRQYDPRRIIREALAEPVGGSSPAARAQELTGVSAEDVHGGLTQQDLRDMDPRTLFRRPSGDGSSAAPADDAPDTSAATAPTTTPDVATSVSAGGALAGGAAAALLASGRAQDVLDVQEPEASPADRPSPAPVREDRTAPAGRPRRLETEPRPLDLLGLAPAPFDVDAT
ncbi:twin-arginine translocase subunit TatB [Micrococcus flavus]|uniref:Sec-independent protein translocase protein TatB n=1 Tax=Micrococcus flavus TaxID=384602 RepID=A0A4Y8X2L6_9MICC|nr:Sec-independent protein translocase protein TatB [Micrococcus flavus]MBB4882331.1 sec-independent protein translocase protein TatB [Micrococcus flavus]TFI03484.1 twin-arginine translocase subunit TatB [Micrococcus flavus]GGK49534.1 hypothetical protein GCM10007073_15740 [Micrococcus flavus]